MKKEIHPKCFEVNVKCSCGNLFKISLSAKIENLNIEVCNNCHPFYTGKQKIIDASGRVDGFYKRFGKIEEK